jgi:hypothetical protein
MNITNRPVIFAKDIMSITGRGKTYSYSLLSRIKKQYGKSKASFISIDEFCAYTGLNEDRVITFLK